MTVGKSSAAMRCRSGRGSRWSPPSARSWPSIGCAPASRRRPVCRLGGRRVVGAPLAWVPLAYAPYGVAVRRSARRWSGRRGEAHLAGRGEGLERVGEVIAAREQGRCDELTLAGTHARHAGRASLPAHQQPGDRSTGLRRLLRPRRAARASPHRPRRLRGPAHRAGRRPPLRWRVWGRTEQALPLGGRPYVVVWAKLRAFDARSSTAHPRAATCSPGRRSRATVRVASAGGARDRTPG